MRRRTSSGLAQTAPEAAFASTWPETTPTLGVTPLLRDEDVIALVEAARAALDAEPEDTEASQALPERLRAAGGGK